MKCACHKPTDRGEKPKPPSSTMISAEGLQAMLNDYMGNDKWTVTDVHDDPECRAVAFRIRHKSTSHDMLLTAEPDGKFSSSGIEETVFSSWPPVASANPNPFY